MLLSCIKLTNRPIYMLKVTQKIGLNNSSEEFHVSRFKVQNADFILKKKSDKCHQKDTSPAPDHIDPGDVEGDTHSNILLYHQLFTIHKAYRQFCR